MPVHAVMRQQKKIKCRLLPDRGRLPYRFVPVWMLSVLIPLRIFPIERTKTV
jgi:hypothetical protein